MDQLTELLNENGPQPRTARIRGADVPIYLRRITAGEKQKLVKGQKVTAGAAGTSEVEIDIGENIAAQHLLVHFAVVDETGKKRFRTVLEVQNAPDDVISGLYAAASKFQNEGDEPGKD